MFWDVVDVQAEAGLCLRLKFADGLCGRVRLRSEDLVEALAPLRDPEYFARVFVDHGAVAWPGDIDLAPDAMYREVRASLAAVQSPAERRS